MEKKTEENSMGSSVENSTDWSDLLAKINAGNPSSSSSLTDTFKSTFKVTLKTFDYICSLVGDHMMTKSQFSFSNGKPIPLTHQVALSLLRLGSGNSLISIGESFGAHHSTVSQVTWRFVEALEERGLRHLCWPSSAQEMADIQRKFERIRGLPNCCGVIDTTHITMLLTSSDPEADSWLDRDGNHSMVLQAIVDPDLRFRNVVTGWPGKMSDSLVLRSSNFFKLCQSGERLNGERMSLCEENEVGEYIIGDSGFPLLPWLVTPYQGKGLKERELDFNERLLATHVVAKRALTRLKEVWRMIHGGMWRPDKHKLPRFVLVCCILHNIVIDMEDGGSDEMPLLAVHHDTGYGQEVCESVEQEGLILRDKLSMFFSAT
ncbi:PIF / Ping-Pong family of plant transposases [Striga hermonthica]|uniref:PIF / Ping-Pong family of plant transposases n=1 Tax=Striga hermonthica TaxID=68872 RepID=A0A9N7MP37_STRHE|nr:PIF / Ping-Pong family of plant transposases [Striga hermonthica]